jgi:hypothetical protein
VNRDLNLAPEGAEYSVELLEPSCLVQAKEPIDRLALPVQALGDVLSREKTVKLDLERCLHRQGDQSPAPAFGSGTSRPSAMRAASYEDFQAWVELELRRAKRGVSNVDEAAD